MGSISFVFSFLAGACERGWMGNSSPLLCLQSIEARAELEDAGPFLRLVLGGFAQELEEGGLQVPGQGDQVGR
jgi:hypothetical protein